MDTVKIFIAFSEELDPHDKNSSFISGMEREVLKLNNEPEFSKIRLELHHWKSSALVDLNPAGPQGQIDPLIRGSDIMIFALGCTIGKGIKHEIDLALELSKNQRQYIAFFYPEELLPTKDSKDAKKTFNYYKTIEKLQKKGLLGRYRNTDHLISKAISNLRKQVRTILVDRTGEPSGDINKLSNSDKVLVGREKNLQELTERLSFTHFKYFPIIGIGGIGKTTFVRQLLHNTKDKGIIKHLVWIDLITPYNDRDSLREFCFAQFASSLNFKISAQDSPQSKTKIFLSIVLQITEPTAVVFDNLEKIMDNKTFLDEIKELVNGLPSNFKTFLISQQKLDFFDSLRCVFLYKIDALNTKDSELLIKQKLEKHRGRTLQQDQINRICSYSSGIPLLIEWMVEIVLLSNGDNDVLNSIEGTIPETFEKSVRCMLDRLDDATRQVWDYIWVASVKRYHLRSDAINALCENISLTPILERLLSYPLITVRDGYITAIEALSIIQEKLRLSISEELIQEQIAAYYLGIVSTRLKLPMESFGKTESYHEMLKDKDNFIRALKYYIEKSETSDIPLGYRYRICLYHFTVGISWFLWVNGFMAERIEYLTKAIEISIKNEEEPELCLANINDVAWMHYYMRNLSMVEQVLAQLDKPMFKIPYKSNIRYMAMIDRLKATILIIAPKHGQDPVPLLKHALKVFSEIGEHRRVASVRNELGLYHYSRGEYQDAYKSYRLALKIALKIDEKHSLPIYYWHVGEVLLALYKQESDIKKLDLAISNLEKGLEASKDFRKQSEALICGCLAEAYFLKAQKEQAEEFLSKAEEIYREIGDPVGLASIAKLKNEITNHM